MTPQQLNQHMQSAVQLHQQGKLASAEQLYRAALKSFPDNSDIMNLLGTLCSQDNRPEEGLSYLQQALSLQPGHPHYLLNLGQTQVQMGLFSEAIKNFNTVLSVQPRSAVTHFNLANCYKHNRQLEQACQHYEHALSIDGSNEKYWYNYANTLQSAGRFKSAIESYEKVLAINPANARAHNNIGVVLTEWDRFDEARSHYLTAIELQADFVDAMNNLFQYYDANGETDNARKILHDLQQVKPDDIHLALKQSAVFPIIALSEDELAMNVSALAEKIKSIDANLLKLKDIIKYDLSYPSIAIYYGHDDTALRKSYAALFSRVIKPLPALAKKQPGEKPEIAFIVTAGHEGVFLKCMAGLIKNLPASINHTIVCSSPNGKLILEKDLPEESYLELDNDIEIAAQQIHNHRFDILYYWEVGTDCTNYFLPFFKAARVQVACWGWPSTSGITAMDYFLSSALLEPEHAEKNYAEKLIKLSRLPVYYYRPPVADETVSKQHFGFNNEQHLYLCAQNLRKVHPQMDKVFLQILQQDETAQILLIDDKRENITQLLKNRLQKNTGQLFNRIHFISRMPAKDYLALVKTVDVLLDTFHYTGGANTNYDAFAAGTPVVTLPSAFHRGRYTCAAYKQINYLECVAKDEADYVSIALALAADKSFHDRASQAVLQGCDRLLEDSQAVDEFAASIINICNEL